MGFHEVEHVIQELIVQYVGGHESSMRKLIAAADGQVRRSKCQDSETLYSIETVRSLSVSNILEARVLMCGTRVWYDNIVFFSV
jgi:hypothetical protein